jgi:hypothetical protein
MGTMHTAGPWSVVGDRIISKATYDTIASIGWPSNRSCTISDSGVTEANARLLAAAPELFDACAAVWSALADTDEAYLLKVADECRAAIAKATGQ